MATDRRKLWSVLLFIGIFVPVIIVFALTLLYPARHDLGTPAIGGSGPSLLSRPRTPGSGGGRVDAPLQAAGDGHALWVAHPFLGDPGGNTKYYEVLMRAGNSGLWSVVQDGGRTAFHGFPAGIAVQSGSGEGSSAGMPCVFSEDGHVDEFTLEKQNPLGRLPNNQAVVAVAASPDRLFALTLGPPHPVAETATATANLEASASAPASSRTATASAPTPAVPAASAPASQASSILNLFYLKAGSWNPLPALFSTEPGAVFPSPEAHVAMAVDAGRLLAIWYEPSSPAQLMVRALDVASANASWGQASRVALPQDPPTPDSRLLAATLDQSLYVFWTVAEGSSVGMRGGWLITDPASANDLTFAPQIPLLTLHLGTSAQEVSPSHDVAIGASENALAVVVNRKDGALACVLFDAHGNRLSETASVEAHLPRHEMQIGQNVLMLLLVLVFSLSLWQWRQKPAPPALPKGLIAAPLHLRGLAFLIDAAIPYAAVLFIFNTWSNGAFALLASWMSALWTPEQLVTSPELYTCLGLYLLHVTVGELFFRRSVGKALFGLQLLMCDGRAPTVGAVLLRNLVRLPEMIVGVAALYILVSEHHQRLGDLLARTMVTASEPPQAPDDADKQE